ncbi:MAG TPA: hypothetical protein VI385_03855, partial [Flavisolibacter sp.]
MRTRLHCLVCSLLLLSFYECCAQKHIAANKKEVVIVVEPHANPRIEFGASRLLQALEASGYRSELVHQNKQPVGKRSIVVGTEHSSLVAAVSDKRGMYLPENKPKEGFTIGSVPNGNLFVSGTDYSGALYGCLELADRIKQSGKLPDSISFSDAPQMVLRGECIGLQKSTYLPGRKVYEYPYTPQTFPWFYDKVLWVRVLDSMVENRMNSLYLWNGHPFASLVRLKDYPYAVEVDDSTFRKNEEVFSFLTKEADKRGIWVIQMFYNIIVSKPFAEHNGLVTQDRNRHIIPIIADYTRKSIAAFVEKYPNVGLMCALGEAMEGVGQDDI